MPSPILQNSAQVLFIAAEPLSDKIVWESGNKYTFRLRASTYMQTAMLVPDAAKAGKKRWAIVYPNYEYGQAATTTFKQQMQAQQGAGLEFVEQAVPLGKIEPGAVVQALIDARPDAIFSSLFGPDLARFVREGRLRGLFKDRPVFNLLGGEPEYLDPLKDETPIGWFVTGYPWYAIDTPEHKRFRDAYQKKFNDYPRLGSVVGYSAVKSAAAALAACRSRPTPRSSSPRCRICASIRRSARSRIARSTTSRRWAHTLDAPMSATARASWSTGATRTERTTCRPTTSCAGCVRSTDEVRGPAQATAAAITMQ